jgi:CHASE2 domain-containing sensor protein
MVLKKHSLLSELTQLLDGFWRAIASRKLDLVVAILAVTGVVLGVRQLGWLQPMELAAFDLMIRWRADDPPDPRLLVVAITEQDIEALGQYPISDRVLADTLEQLAQYQPQVIGLDLARNVPVKAGHGELVKHLKNPALIGITYIGNHHLERVPPPPGVPAERVGFSDVLLDPDGIVRRNSMYTPVDDEVLHSFSLRVALAYLEDRGIEPELTARDELQLDETVFPRLQRHSGGYQTLDDGDYQILLNYRSRDAVARQVTLEQVLAGEIAPDWVKDKIVLIGVTAPNVHDLHPTPYSTTKTENPLMPGVVLHAQMVSQILSAVLDDRPLFWFWPEWVEIVWIGGWSVVGGILVSRLQNPLLLSASALIALGVLFGCTLSLFIEGGWIPLAAPALAVVSTGTAIRTYQLQQSRQQEKMVMKLLGQQTSPEIAAALWNERDRLLTSGLIPGQRLTATILLTDIRGFSTIAEQRPPEAVMAWLNEYLPLMTHEVLAHHGIVNKFTGDGLLAVFGVPVPADNEAEVADDARRAVACALAMGDRLYELNYRWRDYGLPVVQMRVGIFTGPVMAGSLGGKERLEYGVIGDSVNIAARLESCEKHRQPSHCRILIARQTLEYLGGEFKVEPWGPLELKGKQKRIDVYRVLGHLPKRSPQS